MHIHILGICDTSHEGAANAEDMDMHRGILCG